MGRPIKTAKMCTQQMREKLGIFKRNEMFISLWGQKIHNEDSSIHKDSVALEQIN